MTFLNVTPEIAIRLWNEMMKVYFQTDDPDKLERFNRTIEGFCLLKTALIPAIWVNMKEEHKKKSVEAARSYLFPRMEALLDELNEMMI